MSRMNAVRRADKKRRNAQSNFSEVCQGTFVPGTKIQWETYRNSKRHIVQATIIEYFPWGRMRVCNINTGVEYHKEIDSLLYMGLEIVE